MGMSRDVFGDKDQFLSGEGKGNGYGERPKMRVFFLCKIPIIKQDTNFISQTVGQTNF